MSVKDIHTLFGDSKQTNSFGITQNAKGNEFLGLMRPSLKYIMSAFPPNHESLFSVVTQESIALTNKEVHFKG